MIGAVERDEVLGVPRGQEDIGGMVDAEFAVQYLVLSQAAQHEELVGNAVTHGFPDGRTGEVRLVIAPGPDGRWILTVEDDGVGYDPTRAGQGFGLWFIRSLATQIHGTFTLQGHTGTTARLDFTP